MKKNNKKIKSNKVNTTIIELLCIIVILFVIIFIGLYGINVLSNSSLKDNIYEIEKTINNACEKYLSNNNETSLTIDKIIEIPLIKIKDKGYLEEDILNNKGDNCIDKSYVKVYKKTDNTYQYTPYIYCDNLDYSSDGVINAYFVNAKKEDNLYDISNTLLTIEISGGSTPQNTPLKIENYSYKISVINKDNNLENIYQASGINTNNQSSIVIQENLSNYIKTNKVKDVLVDVEVKNTALRITTEKYRLTS